MERKFDNTPTAPTSIEDFSGWFGDQLTPKSPRSTQSGPTAVAEVPLYDYAYGVKGMRVLLDREPLIDGVFAASDSVAAGALEVLRDTGRSVPGAVGIVGFDDNSWALRTQPPLSTVHQPAREIGQNAAELVLLQVRGTEPARSIVLDTRVVWRDSA